MTFPFVATHIWPSGPAMIDDGPSIRTIGVVVVLVGSVTENFATLFSWVTHIAPSGPTAMPVGRVTFSRSNSVTTPAGVIRATLLVASVSVTHMLPSGP